MSLSRFLARTPALAVLVAGLCSGPAVGQGTVWIDPVRNQLARLELRAREDIKLLAGIFGRVSKGSEARARGFLDDDIWLLERLELKLDARLYFVKGYRRHITVDYQGYEKFSVTTQERLQTPSEDRNDASGEPGVSRRR